MAILFQPLSRTLGQREGCLTPQNIQEESRNLAQVSPFAQKPSFSNANESTSSNHDILSPPLSPYRKEPVAEEPVLSSQKSYIDTIQPFRIEDYRSYSLKVCPWKNVSADYKERHLRFLNQYSVSSSNSHHGHSMRLSERRADRANSQKKRNQLSGSDSDSESVERVRTRRVVKESLVSLSEIDTDQTPAPSLPPKRRKVKKEPLYVGSPLAAQQAALIDENIPDYSPDATLTLPKGNSRCLKIEWKGQPMDLRTDPDAEKLHPAEVILASTLRLPCNVYLDSKRRLFSEKVTRLRSDMPFRRTDAQKACRIDVNKASRLFAAFEKVGWLNDEHFLKYL